MLQAANDLLLAMADPVLGWMLLLPTDAALVIVAAGTGAALTFVRLFTTNQELLGRIDADKGRLKQLIREAKTLGDSEALKRHRATVAMLGPRAMMAEGKPLLVSLPIVVFLAAWAFARLGFVPTRPGEPVTVRATFTALAADGVAHIVPQEGLSAPGGWIARIKENEAAEDGKSPAITAEWQVVAGERDEPYVLEIRQGGHTHTKELLVDGRRYSPPREVYGEGVGDWGGPGDELREVALGMAEYRPFGFVPGIPWILFAPWLVGYLAVAVPLVFALKRIFRIH